MDECKKNGRDLESRGFGSARGKDSHIFYSGGLSLQKNKMNLAGLKTKIQETGISELCYSFGGGLPNEAYCLTKTDTGWEVYYSERGNKNSLQKFEDECQACDFFYSLLMADSIVTGTLKRG